MEKFLIAAVFILTLAVLTLFCLICSVSTKQASTSKNTHESGAKIDFTDQSIILQTEVQKPIETATEPPKQPKTIELVATAYCSCKKCCGKWAENRPTDEHGTGFVFTATGTQAIQGRTIAVDPTVIPYGTKLLIKGAEGIPDNIYIAEDCGGAIKGNRIDIYFCDHSAAWRFGVQNVTAVIVE